VRQAEVDAIFARLGDEMKGLKYDASRIPATKPGIRDLRVDDAGYLWVAPHTSFEADSSAFDVFDAEGVYLGRLIAPLRMAQYATLEISSNEMLGFTRDELDVPYVVRLRIAGRPASAGERLQ
jgi:hypothetical protein